MTSTHWVDEKAKPTPNPSLGRGIAAENWNRDNCSVFVKKWLKPIKWAKNAKNGKNERFLSGFCTNKRFLVIGFQCFVLSFQERPMNRPSNCSWPPKITENIVKNFCQWDWAGSSLRPSTTIWRLSFFFSSKNHRKYNQKSFLSSPCADCHSTLWTMNLHYSFPSDHRRPSANYRFYHFPLISRDGLYAHQQTHILLYFFCD